MPAAAYSMLEQPCSNSRRRDDPESGPKFRENTNSRRYAVRDEIDPSTYSFTTALKALQARSHVYYISSSSSSSSDRFCLNSKWNDAEKYICNPLSGKVPLECLSAKTLLSSSRSLSSRIAIYPSNLQLIHPKFPIIEHDNNNNTNVKFTSQEKKKSRDVGIQSTPESSYSRNLSEETSRNDETTDQGDSSSVSSANQKPGAHQVEVIERKEGRERKKLRRGRRGCGLTLKGLWHKYSLNCKSTHNNNNPTFRFHINACFNEY